MAKNRRRPARSRVSTDASSGVGGASKKSLDFNDYLKIITLPVVISIAWTVLSNLVSIVSGLLGTLAALAGILLAFGLPLYVGWSTVKKHSGSLLNGVIAGAVYGAITGALSGIVNLVFIVSGLANTAAAGGLNSTGTAMAGGIFIFAYIFGMALLVILTTIIGAILAAIGSFIATSMN